MPLQLLGQRGVLIVSTNNCPAILPQGIRPHVWIHTDPPAKFHDSIHRDPAILKFVPVREWNPGRKNKKCLRHRDPQTGELERIVDLPARDCPGTFGYQRNTAIDAENWLYEPSINRGNDKEHGPGGETPNGFAKGINTLYAALRLCFVLGIRTVYMCGCDFRMTNEAAYAFNQGKHAGGVESNNGAYAAMSANFRVLKPKLDAAGFNVFNCTPESHFRVFPRLDFEEAIRLATEHFEQKLDCRNWYDHA
jgi:hypothetical protein